METPPVQHMKKILKVRNVTDYSRYFGVPDQHPLVCVINFAELSPVRHTLNDYSVYGLFFMDEAEINLSYGCGRYDYTNGTMICVAPGQIGGKEDNGELVALTGWALLFHPDLLHGTSLERRIDDFNYFDYRVNEALHLTHTEREIIISLFSQLKAELDNDSNSYKREIIVGYIELILSYCGRFYDRQFMTRRLDNSDILVRFDSLLREYFENRLQLSDGIPTVQFCAQKLCLSPNYFSDVISRMTNDTAGNYIRRHVMQIAKNKLSSGAGISEVAYEMGFSYPQHFSRMFRNVEGISPSQYIKSIKKD